MSVKPIMPSTAMTLMAVQIIFVVFRDNIAASIAHRVLARQGA